MAGPVRRPTRCQRSPGWVDWLRCLALLIIVRLPLVLLGGWRLQGHRRLGLWGPRGLSPANKMFGRRVHLHGCCSCWRHRC
jgi:hypothetical protein